VVVVVSLLSLHPSIRGQWWAIPDGEASDAIRIAGIVMAAVFMIIYVALVLLIGRRHGWARWALLVYVISTTLIGASDFPRSVSQTPAAAFIDVLTTLAELWAFYLLFFGPGAQWFRRTHAF
jgi:hypothetical protein